MAVKSTGVLSQQVDLSAKQALDTLCNQMDAYAIAKRVKQPKKGDVLSRIISEGVKSFDIKAYFGDK